MDHAIVPRHIVLWCNAQLTLADALLRIGPADPGALGPNRAVGRGLLDAVRSGEADPPT
jgi:hypothetical protein